MKPLHALAAAALAALSLGAHAVGRLADFSIFDRASGRELPVTFQDGRWYVVGKPGNEYQVQVRNRAGEDLLAVVSVDGVNVMNGETASPGQSGYVISQWSRTVIRGWRKSLDQTAAFYFTPLGDSYAARTERPDNVGVIAVALFQRKRYDPARDLSAAPAMPLRPLAESKRENHDTTRDRVLPEAPTPAASSAPAAPAASTAPLGTGHGRREDSPVRWVDFERATAGPAETIAIYYDSYPNLVARGIIAPASPRHPDPFPSAFVPDPPRRRW